MSTVRVATPGARTATPGVTVVRSRAPTSQQIRVIGTGQQVVKTGTGQVMTPVKIVSQQSLQGMFGHWCIYSHTQNMDTA